MSKRQCRHCDQRKPYEETVLVQRSGGGSYRRAPRMISTTICRECVLDLAPMAGNPRGHGTISRWSGTGLWHAAQRFGYNGPRHQFRGGHHA